MPSAVNHKTPEKLRRRIDVELAKRGWKHRHLATQIGRARNTVNRAINHGENSVTLDLILTTLGIRK